MGTRTAATPTPPDDGAAAAPLVSVVIPVYNRAHLIARAVRSALSQNYRNIEIIVVDDASTDGTASALADLVDPRLRRLSHPTNRGAAAARNTGVAAARGEYVAFLDSDDVWFPAKLARQVAAMRGQPPEVAGHVCGYDCLRIGYPIRRVMPDWTARNFRRRQFYGCTCGPGTTLLCRRAAFDEVGPFDEELRRLEDWDWLLRVAEKGYRLLGSSEILARVEVSSTSTRRGVDAALERIRHRHLAQAAREGAAARRIFEASLHIESAAAAFGDGAYTHAVLAVLRSLARYPLRGGGFYWRLAQRAAGEAGRSRRAAAAGRP